MFKKSNLPINDKLARLIIYGIITDTANLRWAKNEDLFLITSLLNKYKLSFEEIIDFLSEEEDRSKKIAKLKAIKKMQVKKIGKYIFVTAKVGSYEADVASMFISLGADISLVYSKKKEGFRISGRAKKAFLQKLGLHLGKDIFFPVGKKYNGTGGGHEAAGSLTISSNIDSALQLCVKIINEYVDKKVGEELCLHKNPT
jgi:nanoRNase/pAp phosphatase (c-di-AMP/oligoRNAs hydrolase)